MKKLGLKYAIVVLIIALFPGLALAANHYVRAGASGTGADWTNAYSSLPSTLVRGDTYYLADGNYSGYTFDDPVSGSSYITIKKATQTDHGTDTGWQTSYGDGQAIFSALVFTSDYYVIDGQRRNSDWESGAINQYGIRVKVDGGKAVRLDDGGSNGGDYITFRYVDMEGGGRDTGDSGSDVVYGLNGSKSITFQYCALHDSNRTIFLLRGSWQNLLVDHCYLARNASSPEIHGEILSHVGSDYVVFRYNVIEDPEGTAVWSTLNGSGGKSAGNTANGWEIYGNVICHSSSYNREGITALIFSANDASNSNWQDNLKFYNNTIVNIRGLWSGVYIEAGSGNVTRNNIWYNCVRTNHTPTDNDYNWYYNTVHTNGGQGAHDVDCSSSCDVFASISAENFRMTKAVAAGLALSAPYNVDMDGIAYNAGGSWARGAFALSTGTAPAPTPSALEAPQNLRVISQ